MHHSSTDMIAVTDANGHVTKMAYDPNNRQVREEDPNGNVSTSVYDVLGNIVSLTDANRITKHMTYDPLRRLIAEDFPGDTQDVSYTYDENGNRASMKFWLRGLQTTFTYEYDILNRMTKAVQGALGTVSYSYDPNGNRATMTGPDGKMTTYTYDKANRLAKLKDWKGEEYAFEYDAANHRTRMVYPTGAVQTYEFDAASRALSMRNRTSADAVIADFTYTYDAVGNRLTKANDQGLHDYGYDKLNRLVAAKSAPDGNSAYVYDAVGNRLSLTKDRRTTTNTFDADNRQLTSNGVSFGYDSNGNQTQKGKRHRLTDYIFDFRNRLTAEIGTVEKVKEDDDGDDRKDKHRGKSGEIHGKGKDEGHGRDDEHDVEEGDDKRGRRLGVLFEAGYAPDGSRVFKSESGDTTFFVYDFEDIIAEIDTLGQIKRRITHGPGIDEPLSITDIATGRTHYLHYDVLGSVVAVTDATQATAERYHYDAFGNRLEQSTLGVAYSFMAREWDVSSALYYYRSRQYDPMQGRFTRKDEFAGMDFLPNSMHRYTYTENKPISQIDPFGHSALCASYQTALANLVASPTYQNNSWIQQHPLTMELFLYASGVSSTKPGPGVFSGKVKASSNFIQFKQDLENEAKSFASMLTCAASTNSKKLSSTLNPSFGSSDPDLETALGTVTVNYNPQPQVKAKMTCTGKCCKSIDYSIKGGVDISDKYTFDKTVTTKKTGLKILNDIAGELEKYGCITSFDIKFAIDVDLTGTVKCP